VTTERIVAALLHIIARRPVLAFMVIVEGLIWAPMIFAVEFVSLPPPPCSCGYTASQPAASYRPAIFHASFDASISQLSYDIVPTAKHGEIPDLQRCHRADGHHRDHCHQRPTRTSQSSNGYRIWTRG
jgi:hypothetical protein